MHLLRLCPKITLARGVLVGSACVLLALDAYAQSVNSDAEHRSVGDSNNSLEEVVVSAERRDSTVLKTPISITAVSGAELQARGTVDLLSVAETVPGVGFRSSGPGQTELDMRGLSSAGGFSPTVGFYLDDIPLTAPAQAQNGKVVIDPDLYDLNRIEVLRGPQGTLYGSGSMGGTIRLISNQPELNKFSTSALLSGSATRGGAGNYDANVMFNLPIVDDHAAARLVLTDRWRSGWIDRDVLDPFPLESANFTRRGVVTGSPARQVIRNVNSERLRAARVMSLLQLGDRLTISPSALYQRLDMGGADTIDNPPGNQEAHYQPFDLGEPLRDSFWLAALNVKYEWDRASLTSVSSYWDRSQRQFQDLSESLQELFQFPAYAIAGGGVGAVGVTEADATSQFSEELRLASNADSRAQWLVGGFFSRFQSNTQFYSIYDSFVPYFGTGIVVILNQPIAMKQKAVFGEASYRLTEKLKATLGMRWYHYDSTETTTNTGFATISAGPGTTTATAAASDSGTNPKLTLSYMPNDDAQIYGTVAKGFRPGAGNQPIPLSGPVQCLNGPGNLIDRGFGAGIPLQFSPDTVWNYELGEKIRAFDGRATLNSAVYYERWNDVQQQISPTCGYPFTANSGDARVYGSELEMEAKLTRNWSISVNGGYTHASFVSAVPGTGVEVGQRLLYVPEVTASGSSVYARPVGSGKTLTARVGYRYVGPRDDLTFARNTLAGYSLVDARISIEDSRWTAALFCSNLTDRRVLLTDNVSLAANVPTLNRVATNQPRTLGVTLSFRR